MKNLYRTLVLFDIVAETEADAQRILENVYSAHDELNGIKIHRLWYEGEYRLGREETKNERR